MRHSASMSLVQEFLTYDLCIRYISLKYARIIFCMHPTNERWCYKVMSSFIGWAHTQNHPCVWRGCFCKVFQLLHLKCSTSISCYYIAAYTFIQSGNVKSLTVNILKPTQTPTTKSNKTDKYLHTKHIFKRPVSFIMVRVYISIRYWLH